MAVADVPFDLAEVKLAAPVSRPGTVAKSDVIGRLCTSHVPFVAVVAPAGYGKTTLVAQWAEADPRPFAWVALDRRDDDPVVFLRHLAAAMHQIEPLPPAVFEALSGPGGPPGQTASPVSGAHWLRASARWCWCSTICTRWPIRRVWTCSRRWSSTFPPDRRSRSRAGRHPACHLPAGARTAVWTRSASRIFGWMTTRPSCCCKPRESRSRRTSSPS